MRINLHARNFFLGMRINMRTTLRRLMKLQAPRTATKTSDRKEPTNLYMLASVVATGRAIAEDYYGEDLSWLVTKLLKREITRRKKKAA